MANPLKWPGGKTPMARRILDLMPEHDRFLEPFAGGAAVALEHARRHDDIPRAIADLNRHLVTFWQTLQSPEGLAFLVESIPRRLPTWEEFEAAGDTLSGVEAATPQQVAAAFFIRNRGSRAADMRSYFRPTSRQRRGMDEQLSAWLSGLDALPAAHRLLRGARIQRADAFDLIERHRNDLGMLMYLDPPYLHSTRGGSDYYVHELTEAGHLRLLELLKDAQCSVILSGYRSEMYDEALADWSRVDVRRRNSMAGGKWKRPKVECLWRNFDPARPRPRVLTQRTLWEPADFRVCGECAQFDGREGKGEEGAE
jgi:DNA adenine methylase